jgi:hypothetical protein
MQRPQNIFQIYWYHINTLFYQLIGETTMQATQEQLKTLQTKAQKTADQLNQEVVIITQGKQHTQVQAGMAYQLSTKDFDIKDANLIAKKVDNDLEVSLEGSVVVFDDYFEVCATDLSCLVSLPAKDGGLYHVLTDTFLILEDGTQVYFYGEQSIISTESSSVDESTSQSFFQNTGVIVALTVVAGVAISGSGSGGDNDGDGDVSAPIIVSISADKSAAKEGDSVIFTITMSEEVTIDTTDGTPTVTFDIGGMEVVATYLSTIGKILTFDAVTIPANSDDNITVKSIDLNNAAVTGNDTKQNWNTTVGQVVTNFIVDAVTPTIVSVAASKGAKILTLTLSEAVTGAITESVNYNDFAVTSKTSSSNDTALANAVTGITYNATNKTIVLTLTRNILENDAVTLTYAKDTTPVNQIKDIAGNVLENATPTVETTTTDITPPAKPIVRLSADNDTGWSNSDGVTKTNMITITGTAEVGSTVKIYGDGTLEATVTANSSGVFTFDYPNAFADGIYNNLTVTATDSNNNTSELSDAYIIIVDTAGTTVSDEGPMGAIHSTQNADINFKVPQFTGNHVAYLVKNNIDMSSTSALELETLSSGTTVAKTVLNHWGGIDVSTGNLEAGTYKVYVVDQAGNISNTTSREVVVSGDLNVDRSSETTSQFIRGGDDANTLKGGSGNDIFETGKGNDMITGGAGSDTFMYASLVRIGNSITDTITDFNLSEDKLNLEELLNSSTLTNHVFIIDSNGNANGGNITLKIKADSNSVYDGVGADLTVILTSAGVTDGSATTLSDLTGSIVL